MKNRKARASRPPAAGSIRGQWVGGRFTFPAYVMESEPFQPEGVLWLDLERDLVRGSRIERPPLAATAIAESLRQAIERPLAGPPGPPAVLRVADRSVAEVARAVLGPAVRIDVAPTPELDAVLANMARHLSRRPGAERGGRSETSGRQDERCQAGTTTDAWPEGLPQRAAALHGLDARLIEDIFRFGRRKFPEAWIRNIAAVESFERGPTGAQLTVPWLAFHAAFDGRSLVERFLQASGSQLAPDERGWLEAQRAAWLSVWEVVGVEPGRSVAVRGMLTGEERVVLDPAASLGLARLDAVLGRVVDHQGLHLFCGLHPRTLTPSAAAQVVAAVCEQLGVAAPGLAAARLRTEDAALALLVKWDEVVREKLDAGRRARLRNAHGHAILFTEDHFLFDAARRDQLVARLATIARREEVGSGVGDAAPQGGALRFAVTRPAHAGTIGLDSVLVATIAVDDGRLKVETNSRERADEIRREVERVCAGLVRHRARSHSDPRSEPNLADASCRGPKAAAPPEMQVLVREHKRRHYEAWPDHPLPALDGLTPRQAAKEEGSRQRLVLLLRDMENAEERCPPADRFDFASLRDALGIGG